MLFHVPNLNCDRGGFGSIEEHTQGRTKRNHVPGLRAMADRLDDGGSPFILGHVENIIDLMLNKLEMYHYNRT